MELILISFCLIVLITSISMGIGLSIAEKLTFRYRPLTKLFLSPVIGLSILMLFSIPVGYFITNKSLFFIGFSIVSLILLFLNLYKNPKNLKSLIVINLLMLLGSSLSSLFTVIYYGEFNPFNDTFTYLVHSQWLQSNPFIENAIQSGFYPALSQVTLYQSIGERVGASFLMGLIQSGFNIEWSYYVYPALLSIGLGYSALTAAGLITFIVHPNRKKLLFLCLIFFVMPSGLTYGAFTGFFPQAYGMLFVMSFVIFITFSVDFIKRQNKNSVLLIIISSLMLSAFLFSYSNYSPFLFLSLFISFITVLFFDKKFIKSFFILFISIIFFTVVFVNVELKRMFYNLFITLTIGSGGVAIGWPIYWSPIEFLGFMSGLKSGFIGSIPINVLNFVYSALILTIVSFVLFYGLRKIVNKRNYISIILSVALIFVSLLVFAKLRYFTPGILPLEQGATFLQLKTAKYASPFLIILLFSSFVIITKNFILFKKYCFHILTLYFSICLIHNYVSMKNINGDFPFKVGSEKAFNELINLKKYVDTNISRDYSIYLDLPGPLHKLRQMVSYIFIDRKVYGNYNDDGYILGRVPESERNMSLEDAKYIIRHSSNSSSAPSKDIVAKFGNLILFKNNPLSLQFIERIGGYENEHDKDGSWNWTPQKIEYIFYSKQSVNIKINFYYHTMIAESEITMSIYDDINKIDQYILKKPFDTFSTKNISIKKDSKLRILFTSNKFGSKFNDDPRDLNFLIKNLQIIYD